MQGKKSYYPQLFIFSDIEALISEDHILRKINNILDFSFIRKITEQYYSQNNGRPSIDPELFFRMCFIGYLY